MCSLHSYTRHVALCCACCVHKWKMIFVKLFSFSDVFFDTSKVYLKEWKIRSATKRKVKEKTIRMMVTKKCQELKHLCMCVSKKVFTCKMIGTFLILIRSMGICSFHWQALPMRWRYIWRPEDGHWLSCRLLTYVWIVSSLSPAAHCECDQTCILLDPAISQELKPSAISSDPHPQSQSFFRSHLSRPD